PRLIPESPKASRNSSRHMRSPLAPLARLFIDNLHQFVRDRKQIGRLLFAPRHFRLVSEAVADGVKACIRRMPL
ncbi:MAG: hypothetical protein ACK55I_49970, partial [bacterium]